MKHAGPEQDNPHAKPQAIGLRHLIKGQTVSDLRKDASLAGAEALATQRD